MRYCFTGVQAARLQGGLGLRGPGEAPERGAQDDQPSSVGDAIWVSAALSRRGMARASGPLGTTRNDTSVRRRCWPGST